MPDLNINGVKYERLQAPVKFYDHERGYGFLKRPNKPDIFFTGKQLLKAGIKDIKPDELVEFDFVPVSGKGGKAINIKRIEK
jgi:cold shock CspA family protein